MSDDLTVMGIAATAAAAMGREQIVLAHQAEHPRGNPDVARAKPSPDLAVALALPGRCLQVGFNAVVRAPSVPDALPAAARRAGRRSWRRTRSGPCPRRRRPAAGRRPDPCRARWRHSSPRPPPPQRAEGPWPPAVPPAWSTLRSASWRYPVPPAPAFGRLTASALAASVTDPHQFTSGRQFAAWLGLIPRAG